MKRILICLLLVLTLMPTAFVHAEVTASLPAFDVSFNGQKVESDTRQFPLIVYQDITYVPMTYFDCRFLGLRTDWNAENQTLSIEKSDVTCAYRDYAWEWENSREYAVSVCDFTIVVNGTQVDNATENYPLLTFRDVTYFPLTWRFAVDAFGWEYDFQPDTGLTIVSENPHAEYVTLPHITGSVATDGAYYYYNGEKDGKTVVYRVSVSDTEHPEVIYEVPEGILGSGVSLGCSDGEIFMSYSVGSGPIMSTEYYYKIQKDGTVVQERPKDYSGGKHGYSEFTKTSDGIMVKGVTEYPDSPTKLFYTVNGVEKEAKTLLGRVQIGLRRNGNKDYNARTKYENVRILNGKVYYTAMDLDASTDSALYCLDTETGKQEKLLDSVWGFHVYNGRLTEENAESTMIIYDQDGRLMRYSALNGEVREIENGSHDEGMVLETAVGDYDIYTVQKTVSGDKTVVKLFAGDDLQQSAVLMETTTGTYVSHTEDVLSVVVSGESAEDEIRLLVAGKDIRPFYAADVVNSVCLYENTLMYKLGETSVVQVDLKQ